MSISVLQRRSLQWSALLVVMIASASTAGWLAHKRELEQLSHASAEQLQLRALALRSVIDRYRVLPAVLTLDPQLHAALDGSMAPIDTGALNRKLELANGATHASTLTLIDRRGVAVAASNWREHSSNVGLDYAFRPYFQLAMDHDYGTFYGIGVSTNVAGYYIADALHDSHGARIGVIVVKLTLDTLDQEWSRSRDTILLSDQHDIVFLSNHAEWLYRPLHKLDPADAAALAGTRQYGERPLLPAAYRVIEPLPDGGQRVRVMSPSLSGSEVWQSMPLPAQGWTLHVLTDAKPATVAALHAALITLGGWLPLILLGLFLQQRIRLSKVRQRSREELERLVAHYASALRSEHDSLIHAAMHAGQGQSEVLDRLPQGVSVVDAQLRLVAWNKRYAEVFAFPAELLQSGRPIEDLFRYNAQRGLLGPGDVEEAIQRRLNYLRRGGPHMYERERPDASVLEIRGNPLPDGGFVTSYADITFYKDAARELRTLTSTLEQRVEKSTRDLRVAKAQAEHANRNKTRYVAAAVHDLLQPLNAARLYANALRRLSRDSSGPDMLDRVDQALQALDSQLTSMLDLSRLDAGALHPKEEAFELSPLLRELGRQFGIMAQAKQLTFSLMDTRLWIRSDAILLRRVLQNFLSNALHYTPRGRVLMGCRRRGDHVAIEVWDTGLGIPEDQRQAIFQEFRRLDTGIDRDERSAGLGLSIVERIAKLLRHELSLRSWPGHGSVFAIVVPLALPEKAPRAATEQMAREESLLLGRRILLVNDDMQQHDAIASLLRDWGCIVSVPQNAQEALRWGGSGAVPDLLLVDYQLADGVGTDVAMELRQRWQREVPVVILGAQNDAGRRADVQSKGCRFMTKPLSPARLRAMISQLLLAGSAR